tara:strand:- start:515 stop:745 length:231 start_codon:yes stop_codon:yes gene_type:complete
MPRKKKEEPIEEELIIEQVQISAELAGLRLQLLNLSKEILEHESHLRWETHKEVVSVSILDVIKGAQKLKQFVEGE